MKLLLLADANSIHTIRWLNALNEYGAKIVLFSFYEPDHRLYNNSNKFEFFTLKLSPNLRMRNDKQFSKLNYLKAVNRVKKIIRESRPDILHAHYASSYGLIGSLTKFHPFILSVWGADIFNFPEQSPLHKAIIKYNLSKADRILSTSVVMKSQTQKYTTKNIEVTPFGIDKNSFKAFKVNGIFSPKDIVIGTIKSLEQKYGIEFLVKAFHKIKNKYPDKSLKLLIVGIGSQEKYLKQLVNELGLEKDTTFTGFIKHNEIPKYHNMIDIFVSASIDDSESFGVAILEASACEKPVIVSNVGGLPEVVENGKTGIVVEPKSTSEIFEAISKLIDNPELAQKMGANGRMRVLEKYTWDYSVEKMISVYKSLVI
ncbi:MAG: glycosyltransferase [Ignavibacterium sp.]|nr:glycosyltransferase [Ignavibacterium sp.]